MKSKSPILPSIDVDDAHEFTRRLEFAASHGAVHLDVVDGVFCQGRTLPIEDWPVLPKVYSEVHLMVRDPASYLERLAHKKVTRALVQIESQFDAQELSEIARRLDVLLGFVVNPDTDLDKLRNFVTYSTYVQVMGVHPGRSNQEMVETTLPAIRYLATQALYSPIVSVDGGVSMENIRSLRQAGANYFVSDHALFANGDWEQNYGQLLAQVEGND